MSDQTDQQNEGDVDSQSALSSTSKADENSIAPNQQEPSTPALGLGVQQTAPASTSLKSLIKVKPASPPPPPAPKDEALARAMAKMNEAQLDPIEPLQSSVSEPVPSPVDASISPVISSPSFSAVSKPPASEVPAPTFTNVSTGDASAVPSTGTSTGAAPSVTGVGTNTGDAPAFTSMGTSSSDAPTFAGVGTNTGDAPTFTNVGTSTGDAPAVPHIGTRTGDAPTFTGVGTNTGDAPAFTDVGASTGDAPTFTNGGTSTGDAPAVPNVGTRTGDAPIVSNFPTSTGGVVETNVGGTPRFINVGIDSADVPKIGTSTGDSPTFQASAATNTSDVPTFHPFGTSTGDIPVYSPGLPTSTGDVPAVAPFGAIEDEDSFVADGLLDESATPTAATQSSSRLSPVIPDAIPESEFELPDELPQPPPPSPADSPQAVAASGTSDVAPVAPSNAVSQSAPSGPPPAVPKTNSIGLIISEPEVPTTNERVPDVPSLNPDMSFGTPVPPPAVTSPINAIRNANKPMSPIDDDSEWSGDDSVGEQLSSREADNYDSGANKYSLVGQVLFDSYAILDRIGEGSTCKVYSAMKLDSDRLVAIKTPKNQINASFKQRFAEAAMKHGKLKHANIVRSIAYLESPEGQPFFVMEHLAGVTLEEIIQTVNRIDDEETLALILCQIATALVYAHELGICHTVLTPRDVVVIESEEQLSVKVLDFQIAEVTEVPKTSKNKKPSSKIYLSPETLRGEESSPQSDIYSLGVIAYRMATGQFPFDGTIDSERDSEKVADPLAKFNPDLKRVHQLNEVVQEALEADPQWRIETAANFRAGVLEWIETVRTEATGTYPFVELEQIETGEGGAPEAIAFEGTPGVQSEPPAPHIVPGGLAETETQTKYKRKKLRHVVRTTIHNLVALKQKQQHGEETAGRKFADTVAVKGPRRSPFASMVRLVSTIVVCGGCFLVAAFFLLTNFEGVKSTFGSASRGLSELIPGRKKQQLDFEIGEKIVFEKPKPVSDADKKKTKRKSTDIHASPQPFAIPGKDPAASTSSGVNNNLSFGVNNNSTNSKGNRRRIEYRDYVAPK